MQTLIRMSKDEEFFLHKEKLLLKKEESKKRPLENFRFLFSRRKYLKWKPLAKKKKKFYYYYYFILSDLQ